MTRSRDCVLDASQTLAWALPDEASAAGDALLEVVCEHGALVPALWPSEVANGLLMAQKRGRLSAAQKSAFVEELLKLPITVESTQLRSALEVQYRVAEQYGVTVYDAAYLDLALRKGLPLASNDKLLRAAARKAGVAVLPA